MTNQKMTHTEIKFMTSRIYELCKILYGKEFDVIYPKSKLEFSKWINEKTGLTESILLDPIKATVSWYERLEQLHNNLKRS